MNTARRNPESPNIDCVHSHPAKGTLGKAHEGTMRRIRIHSSFCEIGFMHTFCYRNCLTRLLGMSASKVISLQKGQIWNRSIQHLSKRSGSEQNCLSNRCPGRQFLSEELTYSFSRHVRFFKNTFRSPWALGDLICPFHRRFVCTPNEGILLILCTRIQHTKCTRASNTQTYSLAVSRVQAMQERPSASITRAFVLSLAENLLDFPH